MANLILVLESGCLHPRGPLRMHGGGHAAAAASAVGVRAGRRPVEVLVVRGRHGEYLPPRHVGPLQIMDIPINLGQN